MYFHTAVAYLELTIFNFAKLQNYANSNLLFEQNQTISYVFSHAGLTASTLHISKNAFPISESPFRVDPFFRFSLPKPYK